MRKIFSFSQRRRQYRGESFYSDTRANETSFLCEKRKDSFVLRFKVIIITTFLIRLEHCG